VDAEGPDELGFPLVVRHFVDAVENDEAVPVSGTEARHILAIILAAYESGRSGEAVEVDNYE
jgi:predicted dehydrogenase